MFIAKKLIISRKARGNLLCMTRQKDNTLTIMGLTKWLCNHFYKYLSTNQFNSSNFEYHYVLLYLISPSAAYTRQWTRSALVQVMDYRLFGAKTLPEPMLAYCQLDSWEQIPVHFHHFHSQNCIWNCSLPKWRLFCPGGDKLKYILCGCCITD